MVLANNAIRLHEIRAAVIADQGVFRNVNTVSETTIARVLSRNNMAMKQLYRVPFQRNSDAVKEARCQYVERIMELEAEGAHHIFIYVDEAGFNLCKVRHRGRNLIGHRATITVPGQRGANITMCAAISNDDVLSHIPAVGPYNSERLIAFLDTLHDRLTSPQERGLLRPEEFFSAWRWKVYDHHPYEQMPLLDAMTAAAQDIDAEACQGWIRHARRFFPRCITRENIECDVDEAMWPIHQERID
ncbi:uncharacterized protein LOC117507714 [Thalassophryne amazonica]|uniref:uncharacterized protein LOC117507714 n=1 Tax=Thalassophryne amazonica TaxID=390379 RepID=UPI001471D67D|nr:uncharacterized protein LOC117507714 [Thalassophryne amazonica]